MTSRLSASRLPVLNPTVGDFGRKRQDLAPGWPGPRQRGRCRSVASLGPPPKEMFLCRDTMPKTLVMKRRLSSLDVMDPPRSAWPLDCAERPRWPLAHLGVRKGPSFNNAM